MKNTEWKILASIALLMMVCAPITASEEQSPATVSVNPSVKLLQNCGADIEYAPAAIGSVGYIVTRSTRESRSTTNKTGDSPRRVSGSIFSLSLNTGQTKWSFDFTGRAAGAPVVTMRAVFLTTIDGHVYALDRLTGKKIWQYDTKDRLYCSLSPAEPQGCVCRNIFNKVIVATGGGDVICLNSRTGELVWRAKGETRINAPATAYMNLLLLADCDGKLRAVKLQDGTQEYSVDLPGPVGGSPLVSGKRAIIATATGAMTAVDLETRKIEWTLNELAEGAVIESSPVEVNSLAVVGGDDMALHAVESSSGKEKWSFSATDSFSESVLVNEAGIFAADDGGKLYLLSPQDGSKRWSYDSGNKISGMAGIKNGLIFTSTDGSIRICRW